MSHPPTEREANAITWGPIAAILVSITIYFVSQVFGSFIILGLSWAQGLNEAQITEWTKEVGVQFLYILVVEAFTLGMLALFLHRRKASFKTLGLIKPKWRDLGWSFIGFAVYFPTLILTGILVRAWFPQVNLDQEQQIGFQGASGALPLLMTFVSLVILPPIVEEIMARGFLYSGLKSRLPRIWAVIATSIIFAVAHLQFDSGAPLLWSAAIDTFILSVVLIWLREKTNSLWASIGLHMIKNGIAFAALFIFVS